MSTPPAEIPEADWLATPASLRTLIIAQQQEIQPLRKEDDGLHVQLTALATELANLREPIGQLAQLHLAARLPSSGGLPPAMDPVLSRQHGVRAVAASAAASRAIPGPDQNCCRSSGWMTWWNTRMPAAVAARCLGERIQIRCAIR